MEDFLLLKDYQIGEQIGRGGFAVVYSGRNLRNGESVAIKIIDKSYVRRNDLAGRVEQEIKIHSRLDHPSVVKLHNWFEDDNHVYLILELCENGELQKFLKARGRPFDEVEAREIMHQVVEGFIYLHSQGILHRDLSLANLLITKGMKLKICDFGLAKQLTRPDERHLTLCGTPNFISPEVAMRSSHGLEADVWGLGILLYTLLVGKPPFETEGVKSTLTRVVMTDYTIPSNLSAEAKDLISKLLKKVPQERLKLKDVKGHPFMQRKDKYNKASFSSSDSGMYTMTTVSDASGSSKNQPNSRFTKDFDPSLFSHERNILRRSHSASTKIREPLAPIREGLSRFNSFEESKERFCGDNVLVNHGSGDSTKFKKYLLEPSANKNYEKRLDFYSKNDNVDGVIVSELKLGYESGDCERAHNTESLSDWKNEYNQRGRLQEKFRQDNRGRTTDNEFRQKHLRETSDFNSNDGINYSGRYDSLLRSCENLEKIEKRNRSYPREKDYLRPRSLDREVRYKNQPRDLKTVTDRLRTQSVESKIAPVQMNSPLRSNSIDYFQKDLSIHMADDQTSGRRQDFIRCAAAPLHRIHAPHPTMSSRLSCPGDLPFQSGGQKINCSHYMNCPVSCAHFSACACQTQHKLLHEPYGVPLSSHMSNHSAPAAVETIPHRAQQRDGEVLKTSKEGLNFPPLNTARLKATRQRTKNVVMQILENGEVCLEFVKSKKGLERIVDVCRISDDGLRVAIYQPNGSRGIPVSETPPLLPSGGADFIHSYENLPQRFWKKYEYANRFVQLVKAKTPKVTYYSSMAKCCLMENSPNNDFEVNFYNGSRILKSNSGLSLTEPGHSPKLLPENDPSKLSGEILVSYEHYVECHEKCKQYENVLEEVAGRNPELQLFPVIFGRKPSQNSGLLTENKENQSPTVSSAMMPSFGTSVSTISSRWESGNSQSDRKLGRTKGINDVSVAEGYSGSRVKRADVPGLGRIVERTNGELDIYFSDKYELSISPYTAAIKVAIYQPNGSRGIPVSETPPLLPSGGADFIHSYENLPQRFWKKYEYANCFVQLVKAKTPKVTYYSSMAKCCLMENSPNNDFEVNFYNGSRILKSNSGLSLTEPSHSPKLLPENDPSKLSGEILVSYEHYVECHEKCKQYENVLEEVAGRNPELQLFPVIFGRKPSQNSGLLTENKENQSPTVSSAMMPSFGTSVSTISSRWESGNSQSDRKLGRTKGINDVSVAEGYSGSRVKRADVPGLGRIVERTNGELDIYFSDKYELSISPYTAAIKVRRQTDPVSIRFPPNSVLPADVEHRLSQVPKFLQHLKKLPSGLR